MFKNLSPQNKSFIILFCIALVGTYLVVALSNHSLNGRRDANKTKLYPKGDGTVASATGFFLPEFKPVDTGSWKNFSDSKLGLSFKYAPEWRVLAAKQQGDFSVIEVDPGIQFYNMKIYVSSSKFYAVDDLPFVDTDINGVKALNVSNMLYGIKIGQRYYTFDNGLSTKMLDNFNALVRTVKFQ